MSRGGSGWWQVLASRIAMIEGRKKGKKVPTLGGFSYKKRASTRRSQGALGWEMSLGFPPNSHWLRGLVVELLQGLNCRERSNVAAT